jgi:predicted DNA-binding transcriptional regulator YafY
MSADGRTLRRDIIMTMVRRLQVLRLTRPLARSLGLSRKQLLAEVGEMIDDGAALIRVGHRRVALDGPRIHLALDLDDDALVTLIAALRTTAESGHTRSDLAEAAHLIHRIAAQLPPDTFARLRSIGRFHEEPLPIPDDGTPRTATRNTVVQAIRDHRKLAMIYTDQAENRSDRVVRPVRLTNHGMSFAAWCELRHDFRTFNLATTAVPVVIDDPIPLARARLLAEWRQRGLQPTA